VALGTQRANQLENIRFIVVVNATEQGEPLEGQQLQQVVTVHANKAIAISELLALALPEC
jgi:hypothetical protein